MTTSTFGTRSLGRLLTGLCFLALLACHRPPSPLPGAGGGAPASSTLAGGSPFGDGVQASNTLVASLNAFSMRMYQFVAPDLKGNLAVSPLGSFVLLEMLRQGAVGQTREEIARTTGLPDDGVRELVSFLRGLDETKALDIAQKIYLDRSATLLPEFQRKVSDLLADPVQVLSLVGDPEAARKTINGWVEERTAGLLKNFLPKLPANTVSVLVSALYFKGAWKEKFQQPYTRPGDFRLASGRTIKTPMMSRGGIKTFDIAADGKGVILPYEEDFEMVLLLPRADQSPDVLAAQLAVLQLPEKAQGAEVTLRLPRFEFEVPTFQLTDTWKDMGLRQTVTDPDLSAMLTLEKPSPLRLQIFHQTYVKVNEEGTEAAGATGVTVVAETAAASKQPPVLAFDRPFLFILRDASTGAWLMLGRVEVPEELSERR